MQIDWEPCRIRSWRVGDAAALARHANNRAVWLNLRDRFPHPYTLEDAAAWVRFAPVQEPETSFAIEVAGEAVGGIGFVLHCIELALPTAATPHREYFL